MITVLLILQLSTVDKINEGLMIGSLSMSSISLGLTMSCIGANTCKEVSPLMKNIADDPVKITLVKSSLNGVAHYSLWRFTHNKPKTRMLGFGILFTINSLDAIHDIREMRKLNVRN